MKPITAILYSIPGILIFGIGLCLSVLEGSKQLALEKCDAVVSGFHYHEGSPDIFHANLSFKYNNEPVLIQLDYDDPLFIVGKKVRVAFEPGQAKKAQLSDISWYGPAIVTIAGLLWISCIGFILYLERISKNPDMKGRNRNRNFEIPGLLLFSFLAVLIIGLEIFFIRRKILHPDNETEIGGLVAMGIIGLVFTLVCIGGWQNAFRKRKKK